MKRLTALLLSVVMMLALCAIAPTGAFALTTVSDKGARLELPRDMDYFEQPVTAYARSSYSGGSIYIMPKPQAGNGNLGTVKDGTKLTLLAERGGYYFFELSDGQQGWNGKGFFTLSETPVKKDVISYSTVSDKGVALEMPGANERFEAPVVAYIKSSGSGSIYIMPKPKSGNGNLGTIRDGTLVYILGGRGTYYYFETDDGRMGWNGAGYFTLTETPIKLEPYSTVSNKGVSLEMPKSSEYYSNPKTAYVKSNSGSIYFMPKPQSGNGNLGTVLHGTLVYILAGRGGFYFFETEDGRMGWNGTGYFTLGSAPASGQGGTQTDSGYDGDGFYSYVLVNDGKLDSKSLTLWFFGDSHSPEYWGAAGTPNADYVQFGPADANYAYTWQTARFVSFTKVNGSTFRLTYTDLTDGKEKSVELQNDWVLRFSESGSFSVASSCRWVDHSYDYGGPGLIDKSTVTAWAGRQSTPFLIDVQIKDGKVAEIAIPYYPSDKLAEATEEPAAVAVPAEAAFSPASDTYYDDLVKRVKSYDSRLTIPDRDCVLKESETYDRYVQGQYGQGILLVDSYGGDRIGSLEEGVKLTVLAVKEGYAFARVEDGRYGWARLDRLVREFDEELSFNRLVKYITDRSEYWTAPSWREWIIAHADAFPAYIVMAAIYG